MRKVIFICHSVLFLTLFATGCVKSSDSSSAPGASGAPSTYAPLSLGTVSNISSLPCPNGFYAGMTCSTITVTCAGSAPLSVTIGYKTPNNPKGTILLHNGSGGTQPFNSGPTGQTYVDTYYNAGYRVVQTAWATDWANAGSVSSKSVKVAACRPATMLNYVYNNIHGGTSSPIPMCAQGHSGGSAVIAFSMTWYGAASYLDKVVLTSGPGVADIAQGCVVPSPGPVTICDSSQFGCKGSSFVDTPSYSSSTAVGMGTDSGDSTCGGASPTSAASYSNWKSMSVVDGTSNGTYSFPKTAVSGWVCSNGNNNSAAQASFYFRNFTSSSQTAAYSFNRIDNCQADEDIWNGVDYLGQSGFTTSVNDMLDPVNGCIKRH